TALLGPEPRLVPLAQMLVKRGNAFFLEETVRTLVETGVLVGKRGAYRLTRPVEVLQVPATVQTILAARIDRLAPEDKHLLQVATRTCSRSGFVRASSCWNTQSVRRLARGIPRT